MTGLSCDLQMVAFGSPGQRPPRGQWPGLAVSLVLGVGGHTSESALLFLSRHHTAAVLFPLLGLAAASGWSARVCLVLAARAFSE